MPRKSKRRGNGEGTITLRKDGRYEAKTPYFADLEGKLTRRSLYGRNEAAVQAKLLRARHELSLGSTLDAERVTLADYVDTWLRHREPTLKPSTRSAYRYILVKIRSIGGTRLAKVTAPQVRQLYANLHNAGESPSAVQKLHTMLVSVFKTAAMDGLISRDPMVSVKRPTAPKPSFDVWTDTQLMTFLGSLKPDTSAYAFFYSAAFTGMRRGELIGLHWSDVTVHPDGTGSLYVRRNVVPGPGATATVTTPKTSASIRRVEVTSDVVRVLQRQAARIDLLRDALGCDWGGTEAVFPSEVGTYLGPRNATRLFAQLVSRTDLPPIRLHDLRHTHASLLIARGHDPKTVSERLGHTSVAFTINTYQKLFDSQRRAAAIGMADLMAGVNHAKPSVLNDLNDPIAVITPVPRGF